MINHLPIGLCRFYTAIDRMAEIEKRIDRLTNPRRIGLAIHKAATVGSIGVATTIMLSQVPKTPIGVSSVGSLFGKVEPDVKPLPYVWAGMPDSE